MERTKVVHPVLFAIYFVLFTYAHNFAYAPPGWAVPRLMAFAVAAMVLLWTALAVPTRDLRKSAIAASGLMLLFVSYGHIKNLVAPWAGHLHVFSFQVGFVKISAAVCIAIAAIGLAWIRRATPGAVRSATMALNAAAALLVAFSAVHLLTVELEAYPTATEGTTSPTLSRAVNAPDNDRPDIYYIVLDTYGRSDVVRNLYGYDNHEFTDWLTAKGFYVASDSRSNYSQTMLSLASSLNFGYLDPVQLREAASGKRDPKWSVKLNLAVVQLFSAPEESQGIPLAHMIQNNRVVSTLREHGYRFVAYTSGYGGVQFPEADVARNASVMSDFEESLISTTPLPDALDRVFDQRELQRTRVRYVLDHLADKPGIKAPVFVFAHLMSPHSPFVFQADGSPAPARSDTPANWYDDGIDPTNEAQRESFVRGYRGQLEFVDRQIEHVVGTLMADTSRRRIIIIQGDHGPNMLLKISGTTNASAMERTSILNAYYVPPDMRARLYPSITPVNTFRIVLNRYFKQTEALLPDRSFLSPGNPYDFIDVTDAGSPESPE
jgi:hypothetical protein